ncbi:MAG: thiamine phosphate synthase [Sulfurospirillum sp.]|nr:thiamine phosphate synthase [Sulfurospirillum sp.]
MLRGLYIITDNALTPSKTMLEQVQKALEGGARIVQHRDKASHDAKLAEDANALQDLCKQYNATFILNDNYKVALEQGFDGLHVGESDYTNIQQIRDNFKGILGVSCYNDIDQALSMQAIGVDYVAFGSFFPSPTKPTSRVVDIEVLGIAKSLLDIPVCAIGGINLRNVQKLLAHKPDMLAVISDIWLSEDIQAQSQLYAKFF